MHKKCGSKKNSVNHYVEAHPKLKKKLEKKRRNDPKGYIKMMAKIGDKKKGARLLEHQKLAIGEFANEEVAREKKIRDIDAYLFLDEEEYIQHWKSRKGWKKKYSKKQYAIDFAKKGSLKRTVEGVVYLGVKKPMELSAEDAITQSKKRTGAAGTINEKNLNELGKGFGNGLGGLKNFKKAIGMPKADNARTDEDDSDDGSSSDSGDEDDSEDSNDDSDDSEDSEATPTPAPTPQKKKDSKKKKTSTPQKLGGGNITISIYELS
jgi:hypothetical protein